MAVLLTALAAGADRAEAGVPVKWQRLSSATGGLKPPPGGSTQQTGALVGDFDGDGDLDLLNKP
jgi:hypothetical protein